MTCRDCAEFLADYVGDELPSDVRATFERHLKACPNCVTYLEQYKVTIQAGRAAFAGDNADFPEELVRAILAARAWRGG